MILIDDASPRWIRELGRFIHLKSLLLVHGNVLDMVSYQVQNDAQRAYWTEGNLGNFFQRLLLGLGSRLLRKTLVRAAGLGFRACYAETMAGMERANRLYEEAGFHRLDAPRGATGHTFTDAWFWLELNPDSGDWE